MCSITLENSGYSFTKNGINQHAVGNKHFHFPIIYRFCGGGKISERLLRKVCKYVKKKTKQYRNRSSSWK